MIQWRAVCRTDMEGVELIVREMEEGFIGHGYAGLLGSWEVQGGFLMECFELRRLEEPNFNYLGGGFRWVGCVWWKVIAGAR